MLNIFKNQKIISIILKCIIILSVIIGVTNSAVKTINSFMGGNKVFMYFTIQSNIAVAIIALIELYFIIRNINISYVWHVIRLVGTVSITLTGTVFCFVLAPTMGIKAWNLANILTHVIVPFATIVDFFIISILCEYKKKDVLYIIIPPLLYVIYAAIGYVNNWKFSSNTNYPYFFLNWGSKAKAFGFSNELPYIGVCWWILILLILLLSVAYLYVYITNKIRKNISKHNNI